MRAEPKRWMQATAPRRAATRTRTVRPQALRHRAQEQAQDRTLEGAIAVPKVAQPLRYREHPLPHHRHASSMRPAFPDGGSWWRARGVPRDQTEGLAPILFLDEARHEGANPAALDRLQKNALIYAAREGRTGGVTLLLANGIDPNAV